MARRRRISKGLTQHLIDWYGMRCHYCGVLTSRTASERSPHRFSIEHIVPFSLGGLNVFENLVIACRKCNHEKDNEIYKCFCEVCKNARVHFELHQMRMVAA